MWCFGWCASPDHSFVRTTCKYISVIAAPLDLLLSGDAERAAEAEKLMAGIRNRASGYTKQADKKPGLLQ